MTEVRFVIPADANPDAQAWEHRPETWRELADECQIEFAGSDWCIANNINGLGFVSGEVTE